MQYVSCECFRWLFKRQAQIDNLASCDILARLQEDRNFTHRLTALIANQYIPIDTGSVATDTRITTLSLPRTAGKK